MPKCSATSISGDIGKKRPRKVMTLAQKIEILNLLQDVVSASEVGRHYSVNKSTICKIRNAKDKIRRSKRASADISTY